MRAFALFRVGHLFPQNGVKLVGRHVRAGEHPLALDLGRRRDDNDGVHTAIRANFKEEWHVEHDDGRTFDRRKKRILLFSHQRMHNRLKRAHRPGIAEDFPRQPCPVDLAVDGGSGKRCLYERHSLAFIEPMHRGVGIVHWHAGFPKEPGCRAFAHADGAGEADDEHHPPADLARISASMIARSSAVTVGVTPNHRAKPGTAW